VIRFSSRASASGTACILGDASKHSVLHLSLLKVIFLSPHSIVGLCFRNHGIPSISSWFLRFATWKIAISLWLSISIGTLAVCVMGPMVLGLPSARYISLGLFARVVSMPCLEHVSLSIKSSVAPESIIAFIMTDSCWPCNCTLIIIWSFFCSSSSVKFSAA